MPDHIALKFLTLKSDLGWFKSIFDGASLAGKQKGITLGSGYLRQTFSALIPRIDAYRVAEDAVKAAKATAAATPTAANKAAVKSAQLHLRQVGNAQCRFPVVATIIGPHEKPAFSRNRVIVLQAKNWRLDGEFIHDPDPTHDPMRFFPTMAEGDLALMGFDGVELPTAATVLLISQSDPDTALHSALKSLVSKGAGSMRALGRAQLTGILNALGLPPEHPVRLFTADPSEERDLEQAALGDEEAIAKVRKRKGGKDPTPEELAQAKATAEKNGKDGEAIVNKWFEGRTLPIGPPIHRWVSATTATAPYDFEELDASGGVTSVLDVKTTSGPWTSDFYMSSAEVAHAAASLVPYRILRVSELGPAGALGRYSDDIRAYAELALTAFSPGSPPGIRATTLAISPKSSGVGWGDPFHLEPLVAMAPPEDLTGGTEGDEPDEDDEEDVG